MAGHYLSIVRTTVEVVQSRTKMEMVVVGFDRMDSLKGLERELRMSSEQAQV